MRRPPLGTTAAAASIRMGMPQDFFEDVMPDAITRFSRRRPGVHVEVRAGRNYALEEEVESGRLDLALAFFQAGRGKPGALLASMPMSWFAGKKFATSPSENTDRIPLVLFDHPCLFRQAALHALDEKGVPWRLSLTTPSLPGVWGALQFGHGVTVEQRTGRPRIFTMWALSLVFRACRRLSCGWLPKVTFRRLPPSSRTFSEPWFASGWRFRMEARPERAKRPVSSSTKYKLAE